jgi:hypothetical protein
VPPEPALATGTTAAGAEAAGAAWRDIDELAGLVGAYCWVEDRIFALAGSWASRPDGDAVPRLEPALRVWSAGVSRRHGLLAARWFERLPVRAGIDRVELVRAPAGSLAAAFDALADEPAPRAGVAALMVAVLPRLQGVYGVHRRTARPASEAPVLEVLAGAHRDLAGEIEGGRPLLGPLTERPPGTVTLWSRIERAFDETAVFPAVSAS